MLVQAVKSYMYHKRFRQAVGLLVVGAGEGATSIGAAVVGAAVVGAFEKRHVHTSSDKQRCEKPQSREKLQ
jgi:predicted RNA methylase